MFSLDLTPAWWTLPVALAGGYLIWQQFRQGRDRERPWIGMLLSVLQAMALLVLVFQLNAPAIRVSKDVFHDPLILIARDMSGSFSDGGFLKLRKQYRVFIDSLYKQYLPRGFIIRELAFDEGVRVLQQADGAKEGAGDKRARLTSLSSLAEFARDSLPWKNPRGMFLLSDGRDNRPSPNGNAPDFSFPVYPVVFSPDSFQDIGLISAELSMAEKKAPHQPRSLNISWTSMGNVRDPSDVALVRHGKALFSRVLKNQGEDGLTAWQDSEQFSLPKKVSNKIVNGTDVHAVLSRPRGNENAFNDTLPLDLTLDSELSEIWFLKSVNSLDEKWMIQILAGSDEFKLSAGRLKNLAGRKLTPGSQVWVPARLVKKEIKNLKKLLARKIQLVVYGQSRRGILQHFGLQKETIGRFQGNNHIQVGAESREYYQNLHLPLSSLCDDPLWMPFTDSSSGCIISVQGATGTGCLLSKTGNDSLSFYRLVLSGFWKKMFYPREPFTVKEQIKSLILGTAEMVHREREDILTEIPGTIYQGLPFGFSARIKGAGEKSGFELVFKNGEKAVTFPLEKIGLAAGQLLLQAEQIALPAGAFNLELKAGGKTFWTDSIRVFSKQHLELSRVGFDKSSLGKIAGQSRGRLLECGYNKGQVTAGFPDLFSGQTRERKDSIYRLHNTRALFFSVLFLMTLYWAGRKKFLMD
ncbi:hypothetical protein ACFL5V_03845 [Fibrobacterota bacterium]